MKWEPGDVVTIEGQRYRVERVGHPCGASDAGMYDVTLVKVGMSLDDVPVRLVQVAGDAVGWAVDFTAVRTILAAVIPEMDALYVRRVLQACPEHEGNHGPACPYQFAADLLTGKVNRAVR